MVANCQSFTIGVGKHICAHILIGFQVESDSLSQLLVLLCAKDVSAEKF